MFKTIIATLILATASVALTSKVNAGPTQKYPTQAEQNWMDRASQLSDAAAHSELGRSGRRPRYGRPPDCSRLEPRQQENSNGPSKSIFGEYWRYPLCSLFRYGIVRRCRPQSILRLRPTARIDQPTCMLVAGAT